MSTKYVLADEPIYYRRIVKRLLMEKVVDVPKKCTVCGKYPTVVVATLEDAVGLMRWGYQRVNVQQALPHWSAEARELLVSGTHPECWEQLFGNEEEN